MAAGATPPEELEDVEAEATEGGFVERVAVESPVEDAEVLMPDELEDPVKDAAELDSEPGGAELVLTVPLVNPLVTRVLADVYVIITLELAAGIGVAIGIELDTGIIVAIDTE